VLPHLRLFVSFCVNLIACQSSVQYATSVPAFHQSLSSWLPLSDCSVVSSIPLPVRWLAFPWFRHPNPSPLVRPSTWSHPIYPSPAPWTGNAHDVLGFPASHSHPVVLDLPAHLLPPASFEPPNDGGTHFVCAPLRHSSIFSPSFRRISPPLPNCFLYVFFCCG
jgi:hypothetical protein